jgi:hypothetical protein
LEGCGAFSSFVSSTDAGKKPTERSQRISPIREGF